MKTISTTWLYSIILLGAFFIISGSCKKDDSDNFDPTETVTDFDGNVYHIVKIGMQVWMVENLKVTHFNNGDPIDMVSDSAIWNSLTASTYCNYGNNEANSSTYGRLYNWYAVSDPRKIAPPGWHIATDAEWTTLINYLGGSEVAGGKMKAMGTSQWQSPNVGATNSSGFSALPGGFRSEGSYVFLTYYAFFWSSTSEASLINAYRRYLYHNIESITRNDVPLNCGQSVRCIKD